MKKPAQSVSIDEAERLADLLALRQERDPRLNKRTGQWQVAEIWEPEHAQRFQAEKLMVKALLAQGRG